MYKYIKVCGTVDGCNKNIYTMPLQIYENFENNRNTYTIYVQMYEDLWYSK